MTKILLINPFLNPPFTLTRDKFNIPLGPLYVGSYLEQNEYDVKVVDVNNYEDPNYIFSFIKKEINTALCIGISTMTAQLPNALEICKHIRTLDSSIPIIFGGVHPTLYPKQTVESKYVDYVVTGEGEESFLNLVKVIESDKNVGGVSNIAFQKDGDSFVIQSSKKLMNLDELSINYDLLDIVKKMGIGRIGKFIDIPYQTSRGCPHRCSFCINTIIKNRIYRYKKTNAVLDDIEKLVEDGVKNIFFMDENFFANSKRVVEIVQGIIEREIEFGWFGNLRADYFRESYINCDLLRQIKSSGCTRVSIGVESGSQKVLDMMKKDIKVEAILKSAEMLNKFGIKCNYSFMIGLPEETFEDMKKTILLILKIKRIMSDFRLLGPQLYRPYPGSELYNKCLRYGLSEPKFLEEWAIKVKSELRDTRLVNYPWLEVPINVINRIIFYTLVGFANLPKSVKYRPLKILQTTSRLRCKKSFFEFPIEKKMFDLVIRKKLPQ